MVSTTSKQPSNINEENETNPYQASIEPLTKGFLDLFQPKLPKLHQQLHELAVKEASISNEIHEENMKLSQVQHSDDLQKMFNLMEIYQKKLVNIKKEMKGLHEKSLKLKKRALKLQQIKEKEDYIRLQKELQEKKGSETGISNDKVQ